VGFFTANVAAAFDGIGLSCLGITTGVNLLLQGISEHIQRVFPGDVSRWFGNVAEL
jgi:hypothetical protein